MKYLVNRETKEHQIASEIVASSMERYPGFAQDWQLVEADADGWIPWSGGDCPLPDGAKCGVKTSGRGLHFLERSEDYQTAWAGLICAYRPNFAEKEPNNHLYEDITKRRFESAGGIAISSLSVFDRLKSAIAVSESIPGIIAEIDALLPEEYCVTKRPTFRNVEI